MNVARLMEKGLGEEKATIVRRLGEIAASNKIRLYIVGGAVRDLLLSGNIPDIDIIVEGNVNKLVQAAARELGAEIVRHPTFGTATLTMTSGLRVDLATARTETYSRPGALPDVKTSSIEDDLRRRDFSINTMAASLMPGDFGQVYDPYGGASDLENHIIRILNDSSFIDDPTRILRGVRFAGRFDFDFEPHTLHCMKKAIEDRFMDSVSGARIKKEILLIMNERDRGRILSVCEECGLDDAILKGFSLSAKLLSPADRIRESFEELFTDMDRGEDKSDSALAGLAASVMNNSEETIKSLADRLDCTSHEREILTSVEPGRISFVDDRLSVPGICPADVAETLETIPLAVTACIHAAAGADARAAIGRFVKITSRVAIEITGSDLIEMGYKPGAELGSALKQILRMKRNGEIESREQEIEAAKRIQGR